MKTFLASFAATLIPLVVVDCAYLFSVGGAFYHRHIGHLMAPSANYLPAAIFYLVYAAGIVAFVSIPALRGEWGLGRVFAMAAFLGVIAYGAYDFTNQATLRDWPVIVTVVDVLWGLFVTGASAAVGVWAVRFFS